MPPNTDNSSSARKPSDRLAVLCVALLFFTIYAFTAQRGVSWQDSGEFQFRVITGDYVWNSGIARAHPGYIGLARFFAHICSFFGISTVFATTLFSSLGSALALFFLYLNVVKLTEEKTPPSAFRHPPSAFRISHLPALAATITLGLSHMFWWMSSMAEVYTWSLAFLMIEIFFLIKLLDPSRPYRSRHIAGLLLFLACGIHFSFHNFALLALPVYLVVFYTTIIKSLEVDVQCSEFSVQSNGFGDGRACCPATAAEMEHGNSQTRKLVNSQTSNNSALRTPHSELTSLTTSPSHHLTFPPPHHYSLLITHCLIPFLLGSLPILCLAGREYVSSENATLTSVISSILFGDWYAGLVLGTEKIRIDRILLNYGFAAVSFIAPCWYFIFRGFRNKAFAGSPIKKPLIAITVIHFIFWVRYFVPDQATFILPLLGLLAIWLGIGLASERSDEGGRPKWTLIALLAVSAAIQISGPAIATAALHHFLPAGKNFASRVRELPFRDEISYWLLPWKRNEDSAERFVKEVAKQMSAASASGQTTTLFADSTAAAPLMVNNELRCGTNMMMATNWSLLTPWTSSLPTPNDINSKKDQLFTVSPFSSYTPDEYLESFEFQKEGILFRAKALTSEEKE